MTSAHIINRTDSYCVFALYHKSGDIEPKRGVAAAMATCLFFVCIDNCFVVHRSEVQNHPAEQLFFVEIKAFAIPNHPHKVLAANAGKTAFGAEGNNYALQKGITLIESAVDAASATVNLNPQQPLRFCQFLRINCGLGVPIL